ncbi:Bro-N domain-containing protein [Xanthobacter sp. VTT E-85241]|uniref:BRO-N domain-containing protein n=1 Tax=Roseixanthobacter finlandensis TaxID=3119922 RepID=UPI00372AF663
MPNMNACNTLTPFQFEDSEVRLIDRNGEPWFVLADVCRVLEHSNPSQAATRLDDDEKMTLTDTLNISEGIAPQVQALTIINESGLYSLVLTSRKPAAKRFKKWVTAEVLPTLRRTGVYVMGAEAEDLPALADGKLWGVRVAKVNAAARMLSAAEKLFGPEAARGLWEMEPDLPKVSHLRPGLMAGTAQDDPVGCFRHLMRTAAAPGRDVGNLLQLAISDSVAEKALPAFGLRLGPMEARDTVAIANAHSFLAQCFVETQWIGAWPIALAQLPGARASTGAVTFGKCQSRSVLIPRRVVLDLLHGQRVGLM